MLASTLVSELGERLSHPVAGGLRGQMFLRSTIRSVMSKSSDFTDEGGEGYSLFHCVAWIIFFLLSNCSVEDT